MRLAACLALAAVATTLRAVLARDVHYVAASTLRSSTVLTASDLEAQVVLNVRKNRPGAQTLFGIFFEEVSAGYDLTLHSIRDCRHTVLLGHKAAWSSSLAA